MSKRAVRNIHSSLNSESNSEKCVAENKDSIDQGVGIVNLYSNKPNVQNQLHELNSNEMFSISDIINSVLEDSDEKTFKELSVKLHKISSSLKEVLDLEGKSDYEISRYVAKLFKGNFCYNLASNLWYMFNGVLWIKDTKSEYLDYFQNSVIKSIDLCIEYSLKLVNENYKWMYKSLLKIKECFKKISDVERFCNLATKGEGGIGHVGEDFDADLRYVGALNGLIDLERVELVPGNPNILVTKCLGVEYNPQASEPEAFKKFLRDVFCYMSPMPDRPMLQELPEKPQVYLDNICIGDEEEQLQKWSAACDKIRMDNQLLLAKYDEDVAIIEGNRSSEVEEVLGFLQRLFGYVLTGRCNEHIFIIFFGQEGRNGKGVFVRLMMKVLGEYGGEVQPEILLRKNTHSSSGPSPDVLDLAGKRFVVASETNQGEVFNTGVVKRLTGGDTLVGRALYGRDVVRFSPSHTICLQTNYAPNASAEDSAFWARVIMLNFKRVFVESPDPKNPLQLPKNSNIEEDLFQERESILKWIVDGVRLYREYGLSVPECLGVSKKEYRSSVDLLGDFIDEYCKLGIEEEVEMSNFVTSFNKWCLENGYREMNNKTITDKLIRRGIRKRKKGKMVYFGISLSDDINALYRRAMFKAGEAMY